MAWIFPDRNRVLEDIKLNMCQLCVLATKTIKGILGCIRRDVNSCQGEWILSLYSALVRHS